MRRGHRRTQSAYIANSSQGNWHQAKDKTTQNQVFKLLEASNDKVTAKVINYERLEAKDEMEHKFLNFGNYTLRKYNKNTDNKEETENHKANEGKLICIPETNKSSEISSQKKSIGHKEDDLPLKLLRKPRNKRGSDFPNFEKTKHCKTNSEVGKLVHSQNKSRKHKK